MKIALHGLIGSGKSTIAKCLRDEHGFQIVTLAQPIYIATNLSREFICGTHVFPVDLQNYIADLTDADGETIYAEWMGLMRKHCNLLMEDGKPRAFLQDWGTMIKSFDENVFIRHALERVEKDNCVCDDLRLADEACAFRADGWALVKVVLPESIRMERVNSLYPEQVSLLNHHTETELSGWDDWDGYICTGGLVEDLPGKVEALLGELLL